MELRVRPWCCALETFVFTTGLLQCTAYLLGGVGLVVWYLLSQASNGPPVIVQNVVEVNDFSELWEEEEEGVMTEMPVDLILLIAGLICAGLGLLTSLFLVVGVKTRQRYLLVPWLVAHFILIAVALVAGIYLIVHYMVIVEEKDYVKASLSLILIVYGVLFIFLWILVDQQFIREGRTGKVLEVTTRWPSMSSVKSHRSRRKSFDNSIDHSFNQHTLSTYHGQREQRRPDVSTGGPASAMGPAATPRRPSSTLRSVKSLPYSTTKMQKRSLPKRRDRGSSQGRPYKARNKSGLAASSVRLSRSLDHILDSSESNSSVAEYSIPTDFRTLPRLSKRNLLPEKGSYPTDTIRSCRSVASVKSVTIDPEVLEWRYSSRSIQDSEKEDSIDHRPLSAMEYTRQPSHDREMYLGQRSQPVSLKGRQMVQYPFPSSGEFSSPSSDEDDPRLDEDVFDMRSRPLQEANAYDKDVNNRSYLFEDNRAGFREEFPPPPIIEEEWENENSFSDAEKDQKIEWVTGNVGVRQTNEEPFPPPPPLEDVDDNVDHSKVIHSAKMTSSEVKTLHENSPAMVKPPQSVGNLSFHEHGSVLERVDELDEDAEAAHNLKEEKSSSIPQPVFPKVFGGPQDWRTKLTEKSIGLTREQIINHYCQDGDVAL